VCLWPSKSACSTLRIVWAVTPTPSEEPLLPGLFHLYLLAGEPSLPLERGWQLLHGRQNVQNLLLRRVPCRSSEVLGYFVLVFSHVGHHDRVRVDIHTKPLCLLQPSWPDGETDHVGIQSCNYAAHPRRCSVKVEVLFPPPNLSCNENNGVSDLLGKLNFLCRCLHVSSLATVQHAEGEVAT